MDIEWKDTQQLCLWSLPDIEEEIRKVAKIKGFEAIYSFIAQKESVIFIKWVGTVGYVYDCKQLHTVGRVFISLDKGEVSESVRLCWIDDLVESFKLEVKNKRKPEPKGLWQRDRTIICGGFANGEEWGIHLESFREGIIKVGTSCDCGAEKARTTHADWCSTNS